MTVLGSLKHIAAGCACWLQVLLIQQSQVSAAGLGENENDVIEDNKEEVDEAMTITKIRYCSVSWGEGGRRRGGTKEVRRQKGENWTLKKAVLTKGAQLGRFRGSDW